MKLLLLIASTVFEYHILHSLSPLLDLGGKSSLVQKFREWTLTFANLYRSKENGFVTVELLTRLFQFWNVYVLSDSSLESLKRYAFFCPVKDFLK